MNSRLVICPLLLLMLLGLAGQSLKAAPRHQPSPPRATRRAVIAFMRKDLPLPTGTRFKKVRWDTRYQQWEVTLEPPYLFDVWTVNATATDYQGMCFF